MINTGTLSLIIVTTNFAISWKGLQDSSFFNRYNFDVERILVSKQYIRLISSGFLHVSWAHLFFNMLSLCLFSFYLEPALYPLSYLVLYFGSLLGGNLLSLYLHRHNPPYSAAGASGAVSGVIFACIALFPGMNIHLFGLLSIPGWVYGLGYVLYAIYGIKSKNDNIGHDAHLGGGLIGLLIACLISPQILLTNTATIVTILVPAIFFIYLIIHKPYLLLADNLYFKQHHLLSDIDHRYNFEKANRQKELDAILEKIHSKGINSLSKLEREKLERLSQE